MHRPKVTLLFPFSKFTPLFSLPPSLGHQPDRQDTLVLPNLSIELRIQLPRVGPSVWQRLPVSRRLIAPLSSLPSLGHQPDRQDTRSGATDTRRLPSDRKDQQPELVLTWGN